MVLHELDEGVDGLEAEVVLAAPGERVRLVDQQRATEGRLEYGAGAHGGLPDVAGDELRTIGLDEVALGDHVEGAETLSNRATVVFRFLGFREHEMVAGSLSESRSSEPLYPQQARQRRISLSRSNPINRELGDRSRSKRSCGSSGSAPSPLSATGGGPTVVCPAGETLVLAAATSSGSDHF